MLERVAADPKPATDELILAMKLLQLARRDIDRLERSLIEHARSQKFPWLKIAGFLGLTSRQAAEQRYLRLQAADLQESGEDVERDPRVVRRAKDREATMNGILADSEVWLRKLASHISLEIKYDPERWNLGDAFPVSELTINLSLLHRTHSTLSTRDLFQLLQRVYYLILTERREYQDQLSVYTLDELSKLKHIAEQILSVFASTE
jgi:hypothetical protein